MKGSGGMLSSLLNHINTEFCLENLYSSFGIVNSGFSGLLGTVYIFFLYKECPLALFIVMVVSVFRMFTVRTWSLA